MNKNIVLVDKNEATDWKCINPEDLKKDISQNPKKYTEWFLLIVDKLFG